MRLENHLKLNTMDLNEIIISEIKKDRVKLIKAIEDSHNYGFDDVEQEIPIELSKDWTTCKVWFNPVWMKFKRFL